ncbi:MAG: DegT/DnrJ/EryC1/StrS family aminotransferase [Acidimicrobiia bacterium]
MEHIPLVDLKAQHAAVADEVAAGFASVLERTAFVLGEEVDAFEREFAEFSGAAHCVGVGNGTDAVELALRAYGIGDGSEVVLPANTFIATAEAVVRAGAQPVLVDCDPTYQLIDVDGVAARIDSATAAVVPVHLFGQLAPLEPLRALLGSSGPVIIEDAAQCQGATQDGAGPATVGVAAATSFYPGKNLGAYGDAGAVLTRDADIARRLRSLRNHGSEAKYEHPELGFNARLDTLQAVVLRAKLARLAAGNEARRTAARRYDALLADLDGVTPPATYPGNEHVWHLYVVRVPRRDAVLSALHEVGIGAGVHYPIPVHLQGAFRCLGHQPGDFPEAERAASEILSLPLFPEITPEQQQRVVDALEKALV